MRLVVAIVASLSLCALLACGGEERKMSERQAQVESLKEVKAALDAERQELAELKATLTSLEEAEEAPAEAEEGAEERAEEGAEEEEEAQPADPEALKKEIVRLEQEIQRMTDDFTARLVDFINADPPVAGEPLDPVQLEAIRMKSDEDMLVAQEYIDKGGDYRRAIEIYKQALLIDPDNEKLQGALEEAENLRYMGDERFARAKKGMSQDEVREVLGTVFHRNVRSYPEENVVAWFYPKEDGGAAAVWFRKRSEDEPYVVYKTEFEAVKGEGEDSDS